MEQVFIINLFRALVERVNSVPGFFDSTGHTPFRACQKRVVYVLVFTSDCVMWYTTQISFWQLRYYIQPV